MINRPENIFRYLFIALMTALAVLLLFWASFMPAASSYEKEIMEAAAVMVSDGDWGIPRLQNGAILYHTPILPYWLAAAGHVLWPDSYLGYRIMQLLLGLLAFGGYFKVIREYLDARTAYYSSCVLVSALFFCWQLNLSTPDSLYALSIGVPVFAFYFYLKTTKEQYFWWLYGGIAVGILSKGLLPLIILLLIVVIHLMFRIKMNSSTFTKLCFGRGMGLVALLVLPWYIYVGITTGGSWLFTFWQNYHVDLYFGDAGQAEGAFYHPFGAVLLGLMPFGVFLFRALPFGWRYRVRKDLLLLSLLSMLIILIFFGFSNTFYPHYILSALPFGAILIGYRLSQAAGRSLFKMNVSLGIVLLGILAIALPAYLYHVMAALPASPLQYGLLILLLLLPPLATITCLVLWIKKQTDVGISVLSFGYLLFNAILMYFVVQHEVLTILPQKLLF